MIRQIAKTEKIYKRFHSVIKYLWRTVEMHETPSQAALRFMKNKSQLKGVLNQRLTIQVTQKSKENFLNLLEKSLPEKKRTIMFPFKGVMIEICIKNICLNKMSKEICMTWGFQRKMSLHKEENCFRNQKTLPLNNCRWQDYKRCILDFSSSKPKWQIM